jgi:hypothetical protein
LRRSAWSKGGIEQHREASAGQRQGLGRSAAPQGLVPDEVQLLATGRVAQPHPVSAQVTLGQLVGKARDGMQGLVNVPDQVQYPGKVIGFQQVGGLRVGQHLAKVLGTGGGVGGRDLGHRGSVG